MDFIKFLRKPTEGILSLLSLQCKDSRCTDFKVLHVIVSESGIGPDLQAPKSDGYCPMDASGRPADRRSKIENFVTGAQQAA